MGTGTMNADCDFQIGKDHLVCQDYALAWATETEAVGILCDGCSASPDVDIGARLLALAARETYKIYDLKLLGYQTGYQIFGGETIETARKVFNLYPSLSPQAMDATLLLVRVKDNEVIAFIYGDGVFFHKSATGLYAMRVELTSGAPDYLSYFLDPVRKQQYDKYSVADDEYKEITVYDGETRTVEKQAPFSSVVIQRNVQPGDIVVVCSDGIGSFRRADNSSILWMDLAEEFIDFKNPTGVFAKRRLAAFKKKCIKEGWTHRDDISVSAIIV